MDRTSYYYRFDRALALRNLRRHARIPDISAADRARVAGGR